MGFNPFAWLKDAVVASADAAIHILKATEAGMRGDLEEAASEAAAGLGAALEAQEPVINLAMLQGMLAAGIAYGQIVAALQQGMIQVPVARQALIVANAVNGNLATLQARYDRVMDPIRGVIDSARVASSIDLLRRIHRVGMIVSPTYRFRIEALMDETRELSRSVFGDASTVNAALNLVQMATYDLSRVSGEGVDLAEQRYFGEALRVSDMVAANSRNYSRSPGKFWYDVNLHIIEPLQQQGVNQQKNRTRRVNELAMRLDQAEGVASGASKRLADYTEHLEEFLSEDQLRELDQIRRSWRDEVLVPLEDLQDFVDTEFPKTKYRVDANRRNVDVNRRRIASNKRVIDDPESLSDYYQRRQRNRVSSWLDNLDPDHQSPPPDLEATREGIQSLFEVISEENR